MAAYCMSPRFDQQACLHFHFLSFCETLIQRCFLFCLLARIPIPLLLSQTARKHTLLWMIMKRSQVTTCSELIFPHESYIAQVSGRKDLQLALDYTALRPFGSSCQCRWTWFLLLPLPLQPSMPLLRSVREFQILDHMIQLLRCLLCTRLSERLGQF